MRYEAGLGSVPCMAGSLAGACLGLRGYAQHRWPAAGPGFGYAGDQQYRTDGGAGTALSGQTKVAERHRGERSRSGISNNTWRSSSIFAPVSRRLTTGCTMLGGDRNSGTGEGVLYRRCWKWHNSAIHWAKCHSRRSSRRKRSCRFWRRASSRCSGTKRWRRRSSTTC